MLMAITWTKIKRGVFCANLVCDLYTLAKCHRKGFQPQTANKKLNIQFIYSLPWNISCLYRYDDQAYHSSESVHKNIFFL